MHVGCCGWAYRDWCGTFYPPGGSQADWLPRYAESFSCVEVDSTFYGPPAAETVRQWAARTPDGFRFALKVPQAITHEKRLVGVRDEFEAFVEVTAELGRKRGPLLLQFPRFSRSDFADAGEFLAVLDAFLTATDPAVRLAVEVRNGRWLDDPLLDLLRDHGAAVAITDQQGGLPPRGPLTRWVTADFAYVRLLGDRRGIERITKSWGDTVVDRGAEILAWTGFFRELAAGLPDVEVWGFANNHFAGHAPATARLLATGSGSQE